MEGCLCSVYSCVVLCFAVFVSLCVVLCCVVWQVVSGRVRSSRIKEAPPPFHATLVHTVSVEVKHPRCQFEEIRGVKPPSLAGGQEHWDGKCVAS